MRIVIVQARRLPILTVSVWKQSKKHIPLLWKKLRSKAQICRNVVYSAFGRLLALIRGVLSFKIEHAFEPKLLRVSDYWLSGITGDPTSHLQVVALTKPQGMRPIPLDEAVALLEGAWESTRNRASIDVLIPIFCLHDVDPHVEGLRAFLSETIPKGIERQIKTVGLLNPLDLRTVAGPGKSGVIGKTVVDFRSDRIIVIGNARNVCRRFQILGDRFLFPVSVSHKLPSELMEKVKLQTTDTLGSSLLISGFGALFAFEAAFLFGKLQNLNITDYGWRLIACALSFLNILAFLVLEAFEGRIVAFSAWWTTKTKMISWVLFLIVVLTSPIAVFSPISPPLVCLAIRLLGMVLILSCLVTNLGQLFFEQGLTKRITLIWWLTMAIFISTTSMLDFVPLAQMGQK